LLKKHAWDDVTRAFFQLLRRTVELNEQKALLERKGKLVRSVLKFKYKNTLKIAFLAFHTHSNYVFDVLKKVSV